jgi:hypothetical protein
MLSGRKPALEDTFLEETHLRKSDIEHCLI